MIRRLPVDARGFTLLDVLVSIGLVALVMFVTASVVVIHSRALVAAGGATDEQQVIRRVLDEIAEAAARAEHRTEGSRSSGTAAPAVASAPAVAEWIDNEAFRAIAFRVPPAAGSTADPNRLAAIVVRFCWDRAGGRIWRVVATERRTSAVEAWPSRPTYVATNETGACGTVPAGFVSEMRPQVALLGRSVSGGDAWRFSTFEVVGFDASGQAVGTATGGANEPTNDALWRVARVRVTVAADSNRSGIYRDHADATLSRTIVLRQTF